MTPVDPLVLAERLEKIEAAFSPETAVKADGETIMLRATLWDAAQVLRELGSLYFGYKIGDMVRHWNLGIGHVVGLTHRGLEVQYEDHFKSRGLYDTSWFKQNRHLLNPAPPQAEPVKE